MPLEARSLSYSEYNAILTDFVDRVARPVCNRLGVGIVDDVVDFIRIVAIVDIDVN